MSAPRPPVRIANCSGFFGDRLSAAREMVEGGDIDVLTGDWLAELTMLILHKQRLRNPDAGYASTFLLQMEQVLATCVERGIKVVTNAGGLNPAGCAEKVRQIAAKLGLSVKVAHVEGDDLMGRIDDLRSHLDHLDTGAPLTGEPVSANAYLGGWGIAAALDAGADVVVCGRVTDAALVEGPAAWWHGWARDDWDALAASWANRCSTNQVRQLLYYQKRPLTPCAPTMDKPLPALNSKTLFKQFRTNCRKNTTLPATFVINTTVQF